MHEPNQETNVNNPRPNRRVITVNQSVLVGVGVVIALLIGFFSGIHYQKSHASTASTTAMTRNGQTGGFAGGTGGHGGFSRNGGIGTVTAVTSTSVTISDRRTGSDKTYTIDGTTTITDNGASVAASDIAVGDRVLITTSSTTSTTATAIQVNPAFGGGQGGQAGMGTGGATGTAPSTN